MTTIRITIQRYIYRDISLLSKIKCLHKEFNINYFKAFILANKIEKGYGLILQSIDAGKSIESDLDIKYSNLKKCFNVKYAYCSYLLHKEYLPLDKFDKYLTRAGYRLFICKIKGIVDNYTTIYN